MQPQVFWINDNCVSNTSGPDLCASSSIGNFELHRTKMMKVEIMSTCNAPAAQCVWTPPYKCDAAPGSCLTYRPQHVAQPPLRIGWHSSPVGTSRHGNQNAADVSWLYLLSVCRRLLQLADTSKQLCKSQHLQTASMRTPSTVQTVQTPPQTLEVLPTLAATTAAPGSHWQLRQQ
jgi:hypothetical protein